MINIVLGVERIKPDSNLRVWFDFPKAQSTLSLIMRIVTFLTSIKTRNQSILVTLSLKEDQQTNSNSGYLLIKQKHHLRPTLAVCYCIRKERV